MENKDLTMCLCALIEAIGIIAAGASQEIGTDACRTVYGLLQDASNAVGRMEKK